LTLAATAAIDELPSPLALLAQLEATGEISATMRRAGVNFHHLAQCRDRWRRFDPYRELFDALGGWDSPAALAAVAILDLGWPIDEFARSSWRGRRISRSGTIGLFVASLRTLAALLPAFEADSETDTDLEPEN
jgi:hypothetical protein